MAETTDTKREVRAEAKWVRVSPRKARVVAQHIRGRSVPEARTVLAFTARAAAREIEKVLRSAVANAEANHGLVGDELVVGHAYVDEGPTLKRWRPRARGRAARIRKRTCHVTVVLAEAAAGRTTAARDRHGAARVAETTTAEAPTAAAEPGDTADTDAAAEAEPPAPNRRSRRKKTDETGEKAE